MNDKTKDPGTEEVDRDKRADLDKAQQERKLEGKAAEDPATQAQSDGTFLQSNPPQDGRDHGDGNVHQNSPRENTAAEDRTGEEPTKGDVAAAAGRAEGKPADEVDHAKKVGDDADGAVEDEDKDGEKEKADR